MKLELIDLPKDVIEILIELNAPERLKKHLVIVHSTAHKLIRLLKNEWEIIIFEEELVLFGAAIHDIGKTIVIKELYEKGKKHEIVGKEVLSNLGFSERKSRFAYTHGNWEQENLTLEDLLVSLADKIWKGKRLEKLEEKITTIIAANVGLDYWDVYVQFDKILEKLSYGADNRLLWQNE